MDTNEHANIFNDEHNHQLLFLAQQTPPPEMYLYLSCHTQLMLKKERKKIFKTC